MEKELIITALKNIGFVQPYSSFKNILCLPQERHIIEIKDNETLESIFEKIIKVGMEAQKTEIRNAIGI